jgi:hypothetical protein
MKISLKKISEEKFEIKITDEDQVIFNDTRYFMYMEEEVVNTQISLDTINQLSTLFGEFTEVENDFNI